MLVWNVLHVACWKYRMQKWPKIRNLGTIAQLCPAISSQVRHVSTIGNDLLNSNTSSRCLHNIANFGPLMGEIGSRVWDTPANFNRFRILAALLHGTLVVVVSQTLRHWTEGATYIRQGGYIWLSRWTHSSVLGEQVEEKIKGELSNPFWTAKLPLK